jgi:hypothetical protein
MPAKRKVVVAFLILLLISSIVFSLLFFPQIIVSGVVRDEDGYPIKAAKVISKGVVHPSSTLTDDSGRYSIAVRGYGRHTIMAMAEGYWIHLRNLTVIYPGTSLREFDFELTKNQQIYVTIVGIFATVDLNHTSMLTKFEFPPSPKGEVLIHDYAHKGRDLRFQYLFGGTYATNYQLLYRVLVEFSGEYYDTPGKPWNCYASQVITSWCGPGLADFLSPEEVPCNIRFVHSENVLNVTSFPTSQAILPEKLRPVLSLDILGNSFTFVPIVELIYPSSKGPVLALHLENTDTALHVYAIHIDSAGFPHVWEIS